MVWPFNKKKQVATDLPPFLDSNAKEQEIELIPEELPPLEIKGQVMEESKPMMSGREIMQTETMIPTAASEEIITTPITRSRPTMIKHEPMQKFIKMDTHSRILSNISSITADLNGINTELNHADNVKTSRYEKIDDLQSSLEDISKKLMQIDNSLFGG